jgi:hypothetical protein
VSARKVKAAPGYKENIHRRHFMGGRKTPEDVYREGLAPHRCGEINHCTGFSGRSIGCGGPAHHHYRVFWPYSELVEKQPHLVAKVMASSPDGGFPTTRFKDGRDYAIVSNVYACEQCAKTIEVALAKGPSWILVERAGEPDKDKAMTSVPGELTKKVLSRIGSDLPKVSDGEVIKQPKGFSGLVDPRGQAL